jgi:hypothetical protein
LIVAQPYPGRFEKNCAVLRAGTPLAGTEDEKENGLAREDGLAPRSKARNKRDIPRISKKIPSNVIG